MIFTDENSLIAPPVGKMCKMQLELYHNISLNYFAQTAVKKEDENHIGVFWNVDKKKG